MNTLLPNRNGLFFVCAAVVMSSSSAAPLHAADSAQCDAAYVKAQGSIKKSQYTAAREQLKVCSQDGCATYQVKDCVTWLGEVEKRQPSIVLLAETSKGEQVDIVKVTDGGGNILASSITGKSLLVDPGSYELTFTSRNGKTVVVKKVVPEGQKDLAVKAEFESTASAPVTSEPPASSGATKSVKDESASTSPLGPIGYTLAGLGIVGAGIGIGLVVSGQSNIDAAQCPSQGTCPGTADQANGGYHNKMAGLAMIGVGGAALVGGVVLVIIAPSRKRPTTGSGLTVTGLTVGLGSALLRGTF